LTPDLGVPTLKAMEVHLNPDLQAKLDRLATETGRPTDELVADAMAGYIDELAGVREMLDGRYDDLKSGKVKPIDGEQFFESLRQREDELLNKPTPQ
jgi:predicted transcriptional regulator